MKIVWWKCPLGHSWRAKISDRTILKRGCAVCETEYESVFPALAVSYYASKKSLKVQLGSDKLLGIPLDTYIPTEQIETLKEHLCRQRQITLIKLPFKKQEEQAEYAEKVKTAFRRQHIFIYSDTEKDIAVIRSTFADWRKGL